MKTIFEKQHMKFTRKGGSVLTVRKDGVSYEDAKKDKKSFDISFYIIYYLKRKISQLRLILHQTLQL